MKKKRIETIGSKIVSVALCLTMVGGMTFSDCTIDMFKRNVSAATCDSTMQMGSGSIGIGSNHDDTKNLPSLSKQGTYRTTTSNYDNSHEALDTNDWASSWVWNYEGTAAGDSTGALTGTAYALPNCYYYMSDGLRAGKPSMVSSANSISAYANKLTNDTLIDFKIYPGFTATSVNTDVISDWSYQAVASNAAGNQSMRITMTQGSPFLFLELDGTNELNIATLRKTFTSAIIANEVVDGARMLVFRCLDNVSTVNGYPSLTQGYYAMYVPESTTVSNTDASGTDGVGTVKFSLPSGKAYATFATIYESSTIDDSTAVAMAKTYRPYAFNIIRDTKAAYSYDESTSKVTTNYTYTFDNKAESKATGTVMGILPHQYKNMSGYSYVNNKTLTIRGYLKYILGSSYKTEMTYNGIIPYMPDLTSTDEEGRTQLQEYVDEFVKEKMTGSGSWTLSNDEVADTYWHGKKLNRSAQVLAAAKSLGDEASAEKILAGLEANLAEWFTYSGDDDDTYFAYYGNGVGTLLGIPGSFNSIDQINDHHFHYGYYVGAAAMVGLWDKEWLEQYKDVIKQIVYDIACPYRSDVSASTYGGNAYPYLRAFAPYEGHSWASGYEDSKDGNNQESTSESINAWASIILLGEMLGDDDIRDMGIYLYETEIASANAYWFDLDEDIYKLDESKIETPCVGMVWGGKVDYQTYFGIEYTQGIQICPMQSWSFYLLDGGESYVQKYYDYDLNGSVANGGSIDKWNDLWAEYYALINPSKALNEIWLKTQVNDGESRAHAYHFMKSLDDYGTPDTSYTANTSMYNAFVKDGKTTFVVYNSSNTKKSVTFTSGAGVSTTFTAKANGMTIFSSDNIGKSEYTTEYYGQNLGSDTYSLIDTSIDYANSGSTVTANFKDFTGYELDLTNTDKVVASTVKADGSTVLKVYYKRAVYTVNYELNGGTKTNASLYTTDYTYGESYTLDIPTRDKYEFSGWYADESFSTKVSSINSKTHGDLTLYARWTPNGTVKINDDIYMVLDDTCRASFVVVGDKEFDAVNVLYKIYDTEAEAAAALSEKNSEGYTATGLTTNDTGWIKQINFASEEGKYIVFFAIRYQNDAGYGTDWAMGQISKGELTADELGYGIILEAPFGVVAECNAQNTIDVVWGQGDINSYNIYVDDVLFKSSVACGSYRLEGIPAGDHTVSITTVKDNLESPKTSVTVTVAGDGDIVITTTEAQQDTTPAETTTEEEGLIGDVDWSGIDFIDDGANGGASANQYKFYCENDKVSVVNIQKPGFASEAGIYVTFPAGISSTTISGNSCAISGAGCVFYLSAFTKRVTEFTVNAAGTDYVCYVYNAQGTGSEIASKPADEVVTTTTIEVDDNTQPQEVFGLSVTSEEDNKIAVIWGQDNTAIALGQKYNIYVDGEIVKSQVVCGLYTLTVSGGNHTVKVTSTLNNYESDGVSMDVEVSGEEITTTEASQFVEGTELLKNTSFVNASEWNQAGATYTNNGDGSVSVVVPEKTGGDNWSSQMVDNGITLTSGRYYKATVTIKSDVARSFQLLVQSDGQDGGNWEVANSDNLFTVEADKAYTFTTIFKVENAINNYLYGIMLGYVGSASAEANVVISNVSLKEYSSLDAAESDNNTDVENPTPVEINGFQISATNGGVRTIYSVESTINSMEVVERGLVYGLSKSVTESEMTVGSSNSKVFSYAASNGLISGVNYSDSSTSSSYVMTMKFRVGTAEELSAGILVRAYAKLSDGTYEYSDVVSYTAYDIAEQVYSTNRMPNKESHDYLYTNIISKVNPSYTQIDFNGAYDVIKPN